MMEDLRNCREDCRYCHKSLDLANNNGFEHDICVDECDNRKSNKKCITCGNRPKMSEHVYCILCGVSGEYQNYPGP